jgi:cytochrome c-type biogenesis protein CcmH/NrfG
VAAKGPGAETDAFSDAPATPSGGTEVAQAEGYIKLGRVLLKNHDYAKATAAFNRAREHDPRNADAIGGLGQVSYGQGRYDEAAVHFRAALRLAPQRASLHVWLGHALLGGGHARDAEAEYNAALKLEPQNGMAKQGLDAAKKR